VNKAGVMSELRRTLDLLLPFFDADPALQGRSYAPGKWSARQILAHLTDCELVFQARVRWILSEPGCALPAFDPDRWAKTLVYSQRTLPLMRRLFAATRESALELLDLLPEAIFGRSGVHPDRPTLRAWDVVTQAATHTLHHYGQLVAIRDGTPWAPRPDPA
jgi:uncharacterized damage-inducible protein DinB